MQLIGTTSIAAQSGGLSMVKVTGTLQVQLTATLSGISYLRLCYGTLDMNPSHTAMNGVNTNCDEVLAIVSPYGTYSYELKNVHYELTDHLGNVRVVINGIKFGYDVVGSDGKADYYRGVAVSATDYYPFGMTMPDRAKYPDEYKYGFNGKENDGETGWQDYGMRMYNPALGRFFSVDPITRKYPELTPYQFASNTPIQAIDLDGLESEQSTVAKYNTTPAINMKYAPAGSAVNAAGFQRNGPWFWRQMLQLYPEMFSSENIANIRRGVSPVVDETWVNSNATGIKRMMVLNPIPNNALLVKKMLKGILI